MRGAYLNTVHLTGYGSLSEFINAAVAEKIAGLEQSHNDGKPWQPLAAGEIPQGKPRAARPAEVIRKEPAMPQKPVQDLVEIVETLRAELGEIEAFYSEDGKKVITMTENHRDGSSALRYYEYRHCRVHLRRRAVGRAGVAGI